MAAAKACCNTLSAITELYNSITTPCICVSITSCNQLKVVMELKIKNPSSQKQQRGVVDTQAVWKCTWFWLNLICELWDAFYSETGQPALVKYNKLAPHVSYLSVWWNNSWLMRSCMHAASKHFKIRWLSWQQTHFTMTKSSSESYHWLLLVIKYRFCQCLYYCGQFWSLPLYMPA